MKSRGGIRGKPKLPTILREEMQMEVEMEMEMQMKMKMRYAAPSRQQNVTSTSTSAVAACKNSRQKDSVSWFTLLRDLCAKRLM